MPSKLIEAVKSGNLARARAKLESGSNPNQLDEHKNPLIHYPIIQDNPEMLQLLLEYDANPNIRWAKDVVVQKEFTPLHVAASVRKNDMKHRKTILDLLFAYGANPAATNTNGRTALNVARNKTAKKYLKKLGAPKRNKTQKKNILVPKSISPKSPNKSPVDSITQLILEDIRSRPPTPTTLEIEHDPTMNKIITIRNTKRTAKKRPANGTA